MKYKFYLHKENVWSTAPTGFSSASRDIFDHFYRSIRTTFRKQFNEEQEKIELMEKINFIRDWELKSNGQFFQKSSTKEPVVLNFNVEDQRKSFLPEREKNGNDFVELKESDCDPKVYQDFEDFFSNADHGWSVDSDSKEIVKEFWNFFIQDFSKENLEKIYQQEKKEILENVKSNLDIYNSFLQTNDQNWHLFYIKESTKKITKR